MSDTADIFYEDDIHQLNVTPPEFRELAEKGSKLLLPSKSKVRYEKAYDEFCKWRDSKSCSEVSPEATESVMLAYFVDLAQKFKPSSLWAHYSMVKAMLKLKESVDMKKYPKVKCFLANESRGYVSKKARVFSEEEIKKFLVEATDEQYLDMKVTIGLFHKLFPISFVF